MRQPLPKILRMDCEGKMTNCSFQSSVLSFCVVLQYQLYHALALKVHCRDTHGPQGDVFWKQEDLKGEIKQQLSVNDVQEWETAVCALGALRNNTGDLHCCQMKQGGFISTSPLSRISLVACLSTRLLWRHVIMFEISQYLAGLWTFRVQG